MRRLHMRVLKSIQGRTTTMNSSYSTRRQPWTYIGSFLAVTVLLLLLDSQGAFDPFRDGSSGILTAWQARAQALGDRIGVARSSVQSVQELQTENGTLRTQNAQLLQENSRIADLERENEQLRKQLDFQNANPEKAFLTAEVIKNDREQISRQITIQWQTEDKVAVGMPVTTPEGFMVGVITKIQAHAAVVTLIVDQTIHLSAVVQQTGTQATVYGAWQQSHRLLLKDVDKTAKIEPGQRIATSTLTNGILPNLLIGQVYSVKANPQTDSQDVEVVPYADFDKLRSVNIVLGLKTGPNGR